MKICEARTYLIEAAHLLKKFKITKSPLIKNEIISILNKFNEFELSNLRRNLKSRGKKRLRNKKLLKTVREDLKIKKLLKNKKAEQIFINMQRDLEQKKTEESVKRQADVVLHEVTKKKAEGRKVLELLDGLNKLREAKVKSELASGGQYSQQAAETFKSAINHLRQLWQNQLKVYSKEEIGLRAMLDEDSAQKLGQSDRALLENLSQWETAMFGKSGCPPPISLSDLVKYRSQWDKYTVASANLPMASALPPGWLLPQPITNSWSKFISFTTE